MARVSPNDVASVESLRWQILMNKGSTRMMMKKIPSTPVLTWLILAALLVSTAAGINFSRTAQAQSFEASVIPPKTSQPALSKYVVDLTLLAAQGKLQALLGFDAEI